MIRRYFEKRRQAKRNKKWFQLKTSNPGTISTSVNRHHFPEFWGVSDEEATRVMQEHSAKLEAERNKAEAWDRLWDEVNKQPDVPLTNMIIKLMDVTYKVVEEDNR